MLLPEILHSLPGLLTLLSVLACGRVSTVQQADFVRGSGHIHLVRKLGLWVEFGQRKQRVAGACLRQRHSVQLKRTEIGHIVPGMIMQVQGSLCLIAHQER
jgi:hypothetical protein